MLDRWLRPLLARPLEPLAAGCQKLGLRPNWLSGAGLFVGLGALPLLQAHNYKAALACILVSRLLDGLDGALARRIGPTAYGAWLDIVCDMLFYAAIVFGMTLALPDHAFWSVLLLVSFMGTSASTLAYAALAPPDDDRGLAFLPGLIEGGETLLFFCAFCLLPFIYPTLALAFSALCFLSTGIRVFTVAGRLKGR